MIAASRPRPAMTRNAWRRGPALDPSPTCSSRWASSGSSRIQPTSMCRLRPVIATATARPRSSVGTSRLRASRLPVPPGSSPIGTPEADHLLGHGPHRAVAAERADDVDLLREGPPGLAEADVVLLGLDEERLVPPLLLAHPGDDRVDVVVRALELGRVEHHGEPLARGCRGVVVGGAEAVPGRSARGVLPSSRGGHQQPQPGQHQDHGDGDAHPGPPCVRHSVEGTAPPGGVTAGDGTFSCVGFRHDDPAARAPRRGGRPRDHPGRQGLDLDAARAVPRLRVHRRRRRAGAGSRRWSTAFTQPWPAVLARPDAAAAPRAVDLVAAGVRLPRA